MATSVEERSSLKAAAGILRPHAEDNPRIARHIAALEAHANDADASEAAEAVAKSDPGSDAHRRAQLDYLRRESPQAAAWEAGQAA